MTYIQANGKVLAMVKLPSVPKETKLFAYFEQDAENIVKMAQQLKDMIYIWQNMLSI